MKEYKYSEILVGQKETFCFPITKQKMQDFLEISGDCNPLHTNLEFAKAKGYKGNVTYGLLTASCLSTMAGVYLPGKHSLIQQIEVDFVRPVFVGENLVVEGVVEKKNDLFKIIYLKVNIKNDKGEKVCRAKMRVGVAE